MMSMHWKVRCEAVERPDMPKPSLLPINSAVSESFKLVVLWQRCSMESQREKWFSEVNPIFFLLVVFGCVASFVCITQRLPLCCLSSHFRLIENDFKGYRNVKETTTTK